MFRDEALKPLFDMLGRVASPQPPSLFDSATAAQRIARFYGVATPDGFGAFSRAELSAISGAIAYVEKTQKSERPPLSRPEREESGATLFIDPATRTNLELLRSMSGGRDGSLLQGDRPHGDRRRRTAAGRAADGAADRSRRHRRAARRRSPSSRPTRSSADALAPGLKAAPDIAARAVAAGAQPRRPARPRRACGRASRPRGDDRRAARQARRCRRSSPRAREASPRCRPSCFAISSGALADELPLLKRDGGFVRAGYDAELDEMRALRDQSRRVIAGMERDLVEETGIRSLKIRHNNVLGYYIEVTANHQAIMNGSDEAKARFIHRQTMASAMRFTTTELAELETKIANAADRALAIELGVFDRLVAEAVAEADAIRAGAQALAVLDVSAALAVLARSENYARPVVDASLTFRVDGGRHPVVEQAHRRLAAEAVRRQ